MSESAKSGKRFVDFNQQCASHHSARVRRSFKNAVLCIFALAQIFAANLGKRANSVTEHVPFKVLTFVVDACRLLQKCRKVEQNRKLSLFVRSFAQLPILGALLLLHLHLLRKGE